MRYVTSVWEGEAVCLPEHVYARLDSLLDISQVGRRFKTYLDPQTGEVHDGQKYMDDFLACGEPAFSGTAGPGPWNCRSAAPSDPNVIDVESRIIEDHLRIAK